MTRVRVAVMIMGLALVAQSALAKLAESTDFSFDYAVTSSGGGVSQTSDYRIVSIVQASGVSGSPASSQDYSIETIVGMETPPASSAVRDWSLY